MSIQEHHSSTGGTDVNASETVRVHQDKQQPTTSNPPSIKDSTGTGSIHALCLTPSESTSTPAGEMDVESLCLSQDFKAMTEVDQVATSVLFCRPEKEWFFQVHPKFTKFMAIITEKRENYVVHPRLMSQLGSEVTKKMIVLGVTRQGKLFFWPLKVEAERGLDEWSKSALVGMETAKGKWTKLKSNLEANYYEVFTAKGNLGEPAWPETGVDELLAIALRNRVISSMDHPVIKRLNGEM
jgi:hypothetical protein